MEQKIKRALGALLVFSLGIVPLSLAQLEETAPTDIPATVPSGKIDVLDFKNVDILDVLKLISQKTGRNIVATPNVNGKVSAYLKDVTIQESLSMIVESNGWAFEEEKQLIKVMTSQEFEEKNGHKFGYKIESRVRPLLYAKPTDIVPIIDQLKSPFGKVLADEKSSSVVLKDQITRLDEMEKVIQQLDVPVKTEVFNLSYAIAEEISVKLTEILTPTIGRVRYDARSNALVVTDTEPKLKDVRRLIEAFDQRHKEVLIEAKIVQVVLNKDHKMGVDWEAVVADYHSLDLTSHFDVLSSSDKRGQLSVGTLSRDNYTAIVQALDTVGRTKILSNPSITALNNKEAKILVGSSEPYVTSTTTTPASGPTTVAETINFIEVGVKLYVTPTIHKDNFITMKIKPEVSSVVQTITTGSNNVIPVVETSEAETTVMVKDGVTIVIGGLIKDEKVATTKKVPLLGSIPLLGMAFQNTDDSIEKTEIVIFLTPQIVSGDIQSASPDSY